MVLTSTFYADGSRNAGSAFSPQKLRMLFGQIETDLHCSSAYRQALASLQQSLEDTAELQAAIHSVGREAIRLALRHVVKHYRSNPAAPPSMPSSPSSPLSMAGANSDAVEVLDSTTEDPSEKRLSATVVPIRAAEELMFCESDFVETESSEAIAPTVALPSPPASREEALKQIGENLRQARLDQSHSIDYLHSKTQVPIHLIKALESGRTHLLPEDIYVHGFIRRLSKALELDEAEVMANLPKPDLAGSVIASWHGSLGPSPSSFEMRPVHLYLSYAALMVGAVGGLAWMSNQASQPAEPTALDPSIDTVSQSTHLRDIGTVSGFQAEKAGTVLQPEVSPPENSPF